MESDDSKIASTTGKANIGTLIKGAKEFAVKVRPYQERVQKAKKVVWAIAIVWAAVIAIQSLPYYGAIGKGESYFKQGLYPEAEKEFLYCYEQCKNVDEKDPRLARVLNNLGMLYRGTGRYKEAEPFIDRTVLVAEKRFGKRPELPVSMSNKGALLNDEARYGEAEKTFREAIRLWKEHVKKDDDSKLGSIYNGLARSLREQDKLDEAEANAKTALKIKERASGKNSADAAAVLENLGKIAQKKGRMKDAENNLLSAFSIDKAAFGTRHPDVASDQCSLGRLYTETNQLSKADAYLKDSLATRKTFFKYNHPTIARTLCSIGELKLKQGKLDEARDDLTQAKKIQEQFLSTEHPDLIETNNALRLATK